jgi:hypothetical protein
MAEKRSNAKKSFNFLLFLFTFLAGIVWWGIGECFFSFVKAGAEGLIRNPLFNGIYFAFLSLLSILACLLSEKIRHSIVEKNFYNEVVATPSLKKILLVAFGVMLLAAGVMEFIYEFEYAPAAPAQVVKQKKPVVVPKSEVVPVDYYFLLDNTTSLMNNDPKKERIKLLEKIVNAFPSDKKIALISFADKATVHIRPAYATEKVKRQFISTIKGLRMIDYTNLKEALISASSILVNDYSRKEVVIFITDGEDNFNEHSSDFDRVMNPFISANVPIHSIFLNPNNTESTFLKHVSSLTGGIYSTVRDPVDLESQMIQVIESEEESVTVNPLTIRPGRVSARESLRDLLDVRTGKRQNSPLYGIMRIAFIILIGLLMGYLLFMVFPSSRIFGSLLLGGGVSGFLAGVILEFGFQLYFLPDFVIRLLVCVVLSTVYWLISFVTGQLIGLKTSKPVFALWNSGHDVYDNKLDYEQGIDNGVLDSKNEKKTNSGKGKFGK